jgi:Protein of unknown function (DUF4240)
VTEDEFWTHIAMLRGVADSMSAATLTDNLATRAASEIEEFAELLHASLNQLDPSRFAMLAVNDVADPPDGPPIPLLGDALTNFLCAVVAAGRTVFTHTRADPASITQRRWSFAEADELLRAAPRAYEHVTGQPWGDEPWPTPAGRADSMPFWCEVMLFNDAGSQSGAYADAIDEITNKLNASPTWRAWWAPARLDTLRITIEFGTGERAPAVRRGRGSAQAEVHLDRSRLRGHGRGASATLAARDMEGILDHVRTTLRLEPLPPVPQPAGAQPISEQTTRRTARLADLRRKYGKD